MHRCQHGKAPQYLVDCCTPVTDVAMQAASEVGHAANDGGATTSAIHYWLPSIRCARPHGMELLATSVLSALEYS